MLKSALCVFLCSCFLGSLDCTVQTELPVKQGDNATLECYGPTNATKILLRWKKTDLQSELYVFYIRDGRPNENYQLPSFKGRVQLKDPQMKDGNFSVIIKDVSMNDAGVYECYVGNGTQDPQLINSTNLKVEEPGPSGAQSEKKVNEDEVKEDGGKKNGSLGLTDGLLVGLLLSSLLLLIVVVGAVVVGFIIYKKHPGYQLPQDQGL